MSFSQAEVERYARHLVLREVGGPGQQKLKAARDAAQVCRDEAVAETRPARAAAASLRCYGLLESDPDRLAEAVAHLARGEVVDEALGNSAGHGRILAPCTQRRIATTTISGESPQLPTTAASWFATGPWGLLLFGVPFLLSVAMASYTARVVVLGYGRPFTDSTAFRICGSCPASCAERMSACTSLGKQEPP